MHGQAGVMASQLEVSEEGVEVGLYGVGTKTPDSYSVPINRESNKL